MNSVFDAYNLRVEELVNFYQRLNRVITFPDGMATTLGIIYWGREEHLAEIEKTVPVLIRNGMTRFSDVLQALRTPAGMRKAKEKSAISSQILRILKHDLGLWLPTAIPLAQLDWFINHPFCLEGFSCLGLQDQLAVISAGQTQAQREALVSQTQLTQTIVEESVKYCDYYRTGKNLGQIRASIYYDMGLDTWQKWTAQTAETIIESFTLYIHENPRVGERLIPWPKEVRNGIEWARIHQEIFSVQW